MTDILCSIIIPHFNTPALLERCLRSIPEVEGLQTIAVDDCSPDRETWLAQLQVRFPRVEFYLQNARQGAGAARNAGMEKAKGTWLTFVDADDFLEPSFSDALDTVACRDEDICFFQNRSVMSDDTMMPSSRGNRSKHFDEYFRKGNEFYLRYHTDGLWGKFFRHSFLLENDILFEEIPVANDCRFSCQTGYLAEKIYVSKTSVYVLTQREDSLTTTPSLEHLELRYKVLENKKRYLMERGVKTDTAGESRLLQKLRSAYPGAYKKVTGFDPFPFADITALKGLLVLLVFLTHAHLVPDFVGECSVAIFFVLSGVCNTFGYGEKIARGDCHYGKYVWNRLVKFYPLHWLCLAGAVVLCAVTHFPSRPLLTFGANALLLQAWIPVKGVFFSYNGVSWFLSCMVFVTLIFPPLVRFVLTSSKRVNTAFAILLACVWTALRVFIPDEWRLAVLYVNPLVRAIEFSAGICLARLYICFAVSRKQYAPAFLVAWGRISFEFFMIHHLCIRAVKWAGGIWNVDNVWIIAMIALAIAVPLSFLCHRYFVEPLTARLRR